MKTQTKETTRFTSKKDIQESSEYKSLTPYMATGYAEGFEETDSERQIIAAWQYLHDTGQAYSLQGWFGRSATDLIRRGIIYK